MNQELGEFSAMFLVEAMQDPVLVLDSKGIILGMNPAARRFFGYGKKEAMSKHFLELSYKSTALPNELKRIKMNFTAAVKEGTSIVLEYEYITKKGKSVFISLNGSMVKDEKKKKVNVIAIFRDITERMKAKELLKESEEKNRILLTTVPDGWAYHKIILDKNNKPVDYVFLEANDAFEEATGLKRKDIIGERVTKVIPGIEDAEPDLISFYGNVALTGKSDKMEFYFEPLDRLYSVSVSSPKKDYFVVVFQDITERRNVEKAQRESEVRLKRAQHVAKMGFLTWTLKTNEMLWSDETFSIFGIDKENGQPTSDYSMSLVHPDDLAFVQENLDNAVNATEEYDIDHRVVRPDGDIIWVHAQGKLIYDSSGTPIILLGTVVDITVRKRAEEELKKLSMVVEQASDGIAVANLDRVIEYVNYAWVEMHGYGDAKELIGKNLSIFHTKEQFEQDVIPFNEKLKEMGACQGEVGHKRRDGTTFPTFMNNSIMKDEEGNPIALIGAARDITERKRLEEEIRSERDRLQSLMDGLSLTEIGLDIVDVNYRILSQNRILRERFGECIGALCHETYMGQEKPCDDCPMESAIETGHVQRVELTGSDGRNYEISSAPFTNPDGTVDKVVEIVRDITERKEAEGKTKAVAETASLYLDLMGHDIRNQLQAIVMGTEILEHLDSGPEVREMVNIVFDSVEKSQNLIKKVQATRGLLSVPLSSAPLREALEDCMQVLNETYDDVQIEVNLTAQQPIVFADKYLGNLLMNIMENAILHNDKKTRRIWLDLREATEGYEVVIADNGPGIDNEKKENLFDQSRRFGGVGVHQAFKIIQKYGGHITVQDRVPDDSSKGAEFHIWFPKSSS
ncbi:MAG: PAS domain S-box protein [Candidatus Thorarchaeota archaeon]